MRKYIILTEIESEVNEVVIKVEPFHVMEDRNEDMFAAYLDEYTPTKGDKLYFLPGVNVPRIKLKDLALQHGIKTIRNIDEATHIFAAKNTRHKITSGQWCYSMDLTDFNALMEDPNIYMDERYRENIRQALEFNTEDRILFKYNELNDIKHGNNEALKVYGENINSSKWFNTIDEEYSDLCAKIVGATVYDEMAILKHINGDDAAVIDEVMYEQIHQMFESKDKDNHILAMEIMANSNYIESLLYLEMLFKEHSYEISNCHTKSHVNFKSLIGYLKKNKSYLGTSLDEVVDSLIDKDVVTKDKMDVLMNYYSDEIAGGGNSKHFKVKVITLSDELKAKLNINYIYQHVDDFTPEVLEEEKRVLVDEEDLEELLDEDIETALIRLERNELKSELIALEEEIPEPEEELNNLEKGPIAESNNHQIAETNDTNDFEWF